MTCHEPLTGPFEIVRGLTVPPRNPQGTARGLHHRRVRRRRRAGGLPGAGARRAARGRRGPVAAGVRPDDPDQPPGLRRRGRHRRGHQGRWRRPRRHPRRGGLAPPSGEIEGPGVHIRGGTGVGTITQPGLELPPGSPAINPVPRRMIAEGVALALGTGRPAPGVEVTVSIPGGEELARKTLNARIGILGGLSILGTTGVVRPMSTASWRASVVQSIDVAAANSLRHIVLTTGGRSERFADGALPRAARDGVRPDGHLHRRGPEAGRRAGVPRVTVCGMIGKLAKLATGQMQTHVAGGGVDVAFLADLAREAGRDRTSSRRSPRANTARHVEELIDSASDSPDILRHGRRVGRRVLQRPRRRSARPGGRAVRLRREGARPRHRCPP